MTAAQTRCRIWRRRCKMAEANCCHCGDDWRRTVSSTTARSPRSRTTAEGWIVQYPTWTEILTMSNLVIFDLEPNEITPVLSALSTGTAHRPLHQRSMSDAQTRSQRLCVIRRRLTVLEQHIANIDMICNAKSLYLYDVRTVR